MSTKLFCSVCDQPAVGVCNALGPMSDAFCLDCLKAGRVTYTNLVAYLYTLEPRTKADIAEWVHPCIDATLAFHKKTWDEFAADCRQAMKEYDDYEAGRTDDV